MHDPMEIIAFDLDDRQRVSDFIRLPKRIYQATSQWVPPLWVEERRRLDPKRNPFFRHSRAGFFLAYEGERPIGRLAVLDNRRYNEFNQANSAFFYFFECEDHHHAAAGLFRAAFEWARARGLSCMIGPRGFTPLDGLGLLVKGFEHRPAFGLPYNPPYYPGLLEAQGFEMESESVSGYLNPNVRIPERIHELARRLAERRGLHILRCRSRADLRRLIPHIKSLYNASLEGTRDNVPLTGEEIDSLAGQILWLADPKLIKLVMKGDQAVGFLFAYPDVSAALQRTGGRVFPFGWLSLFLELRRTDWININGAGLLPEYRGSGGMAILYSELFRSVAENPRYRHAELVQVGVENAQMQRDLRNFGVDFYKTHRIYARRL